MVAAIGAIEKGKDHAEEADAKHGPGHVPEYFKKGEDGIQADEHR